MLKAFPLADIRERITAIHNSEEILPPGHDCGRKDRQFRSVDELDVLMEVATEIEGRPDPQHDAFARALTQAPNAEVGALAEMSGISLSRRQQSARVLRFHGLEAYRGPFASAKRALRDKQRELQPAKDAILRKSRLSADDHAHLRDLDSDLKPFENAVNSWTHSMSRDYAGSPLSTAEIADNGELQAS